MNITGLLTLLPLLAAPPAPPTYWQDIRPVFRKHCTACHSARHAKDVDVSGGLALDSYEAALKGGTDRVIQPGKSGASLLIHLISTKDEDKRMPLGSKPLSAENIALIRRWIDTGAKEGQKPAEGPVVVTTTKPRRTRKLDVVLPTSAVPPAGVLGPGGSGKLDLAVRVGPLSPVAAVTFSPDGKWLAAGGYGHVTVWDLATVRPVAELTNVLGAVNDLRFSPDGSLLAVAGGQPSAKGDLRLYRVADWKLTATLRGHADVVFCVAFRPDGKQLASASYDKTIGLWDLATHKLVRTFTDHSDFVYTVAFSPDGKWLISGSKDRSVRVREAATGKPVVTCSGTEQDVLAVAVRPDGKAMVSAGLDSPLNWWNPQTGERIRQQRGHRLAVHEICFSKDGKLVASASADRTVRLWNGNTGALLKTLTVGSVAYAVAVSPNGKLVASGSFDGLVRLWDTASGRVLVTLLALPGEKETADWLAVTPEGYAGGSPRLMALGQWRMTGKGINSEMAWKVLNQPTLIAKAAKGQAPAAPVFKK